jgi:hypothetical protein
MDEIKGKVNTHLHKWLDRTFGLSPFTFKVSTRRMGWEAMDEPGEHSHTTLFDDEIRDAVHRLTETVGVRTVQARAAGYRLRLCKPEPSQSEFGYVERFGDIDVLVSIRTAAASPGRGYVTVSLTVVGVFEKIKKEWRRV